MSCHSRSVVVDELLPLSSVDELSLSISCQVDESSIDK